MSSSISTATALPPRIRASIGQFTGRAWLLPRLVEWWNAGEERLFLLTGGPGTGKSMIQAWLAGFGPEPDDPESRSQLAQLRGATAAAHFCQAASRNVSPQAFGESVANQLAANLPGFAAALADTLAERIQIVGSVQAADVASGARVTGVAIGRIDLGTLGDEQSFDRAFAGPLRRLYAGARRDRSILLVVDALDEALAYSGPVTLPELLSRLDDLPPQLRIIATSRNEPRVLKHFRRARCCDLVVDADRSVDDVRKYAQRRLAAWPAADDTVRARFAQRLATAAGGVFLYAAMVLDELQGLAAGELPELEQFALPDGLGGLYHGFLTRELGRDDRSWFELYEPLLGLIAVARGPGLISSQLAAITGRDVRAALRACRQYLSGELPDGPFRPFHKSFADFLLEHDDNLDFHVDAQAMHARIADHYWSRHHDDWSGCDDYGLENLAVHLLAAGHFERLGALIGPGWMQERVSRAAGRYSGFVEDVTAAWQPARKAALAQIEQRDDGWDGLARCLRLALVRSSVNSLSSSVPPDLVVMAVECGVWPVERAVDVALHAADPADRVRLCLAVLGRVSGLLSVESRAQLVHAARTAARMIEDPARRVVELVRVAQEPGGEVDPAVLEEADATARSIDDAADRVRAAVELAPLLEPSRRSNLFDRAVAAARSSAGPESCVRACCSLLSHLVEPVRSTLAADALRAARAIGEARARVEALSSLAFAADGPTAAAAAEEAVDAARQLPDEWRRAWTLMQLMRHERGPAQSEVLVAARSIADAGARAGLLGLIASELGGAAGEAVAREALVAARAADDPWERALTLADLARLLAGEEGSSVLDDALEAARSVDDAARRATLLARVVSRMEEPARSSILREAVDSARAVADRARRAGALTEIAGELEGETRQAAVREALGAARGIDDGTASAGALLALAAQLEGSARKRAVDAAFESARSIGDLQVRCAALVELAREATGETRETALDLAVATSRSERDPYWRTLGLAQVARELSGDGRRSLLEEALAAARGMVDHLGRGEALAELARWLPGEERRAVVQEALAIAAEIRNEMRRTQILQALAPQLDTPSELATASALARRTEDPRWRAWTYTALLGTADGKSKRALIDEALEAARSIADPLDRARTLARIAGLADDEARAAIHAESRAAALATADPAERILMLAEVSAVQAEAPSDALLDSVRALESESDRARTLGALASRLRTDTQRDAACEMSISIGAVTLRLECLHDLWRWDQRPKIADAIRRCLLEFLEASMSTRTRAELLGTVIRREWVGSPFMSAATAEALVGHIAEIRGSWTWP